MRNSDIPAGLVAIAALAAAVFLGHLPFWLGLLVALLIYFGVMLLLKKPAKAVSTRPALADQIASLEASGRQMPFPAIRGQIDDIATHARAILTYFGHHPGSATQWEDYLRDCLESANAGAREFADLAPHLSGPTDPAAVKFADFLKTLGETLRGVYSQLIAADAADFSASMDAYKNTLHEINQIYLGGGKT